MHTPYTTAREVLDNPTQELSEMNEQLQKYTRGVSGVPYFIVSDGTRRVKMSGAQPPEQFIEVLQDFGVIDDA